MGTTIGGGSISGGGLPLPESKFKIDDVKIHTGSETVKTDKAVSAQSYTQGSDIHFGTGKFEPESDSGKQLLAHELTHVINQTQAVQEATVNPKKLDLL